MFKVGDKVKMSEHGKCRSSDDHNNPHNEIGTIINSGSWLRVQWSTKENVYVDEELELVEAACSTPESQQAKKDNVKDCKPPLKYIHPNFVEGMAFGMLAGELKYGAWNFMLGHDVQDLLDGATRHMNAFRKGELIDQDTTNRLREKFGDKAPEVSHLWLAACNLNMIIWQLDHKTLRNSWPAKGEP